MRNVGILQDVREVVDVRNRAELRFGSLALYRFEL
jgi:hypothetical protein